MSQETGRALEDLLGEVTVAALQHCPSEFSPEKDPEEFAERIGKFMEALALGLRHASELVYGATADT